MKKTMVLLLLVLSALSLAGCQEGKEGTRFTFEVKDLDGQELLSEDLYYNSELEENLAEQIDQVIDIDYDVYDIGIFVNGIDDHYPNEYGASYNYYYQLHINGESVTYGLNDVEIVEDMVVSFVETSMLSVLDQEVDDYIYSFVENSLGDYISSDFIDYHVLSAVYHLNDKGYIDIDLNDYYTYADLELVKENIETLSISELLKLGIYQSVEGSSLTPLVEQLDSLTPSNPYEAISYLQAYHLNGSTDLDVVLSLTEETIGDPDYAGMALLALAPYSDHQTLIDYEDDLVAYIKNALTATGIESWGSSNASSTAQAVIGLVAQGINPQSEDYQIEDKGMIEMLMMYRQDAGFKWLLSNEDADLMFSTPQAFASLVAYKLSRDQFGFPPTNLYVF